MSAFLDAIGRKGIIRGQAPKQAAQSTLADVTVEAFRAAEAIDVPTAKTRAYGSAMEERESQLKFLLGDEYDSLKKEFRGREGDYNQRIDELIFERRQAGQSDYYKAKTTKEIAEEQKQKAFRALQEFNQVSEAATPTARFVGSFTGAAGAFISDPVNIAATVATAIPFAPKIGSAGVARGLLGLSLREAAANAAAEAAVQPMIADWYSDLGFNYGLSQFATNVGMASVLGGAIPPALYASKKGASFLFQKMETALPPRMKPHAQMMQRVAHVEENNIAPASRPDATVVHVGHVSKIEQAFEARQPLPDISAIVPQVDIATPFRSEKLTFEPVADAPGMQRIAPLPKNEMAYVDRAVQDVEIASGIKRATPDDGDEFFARGELPEWFKKLNKAEIAQAKKSGRRANPITPRRVKNIAAKMATQKPLSKQEAKVANALYRQAQQIQAREFSVATPTAKAAPMRQADDFAVSEITERTPLQAEEMTPETIAAMEADVQRSLKTNAGTDIFFDDGTVIRMADLLEAQKADLSFIDQIRTCAI